MGGASDCLFFAVDDVWMVFVCLLFPRFLFLSDSEGVCVSSGFGVWVGYFVVGIHQKRD